MTIQTHTFIITKPVGSPRSSRFDPTLPEKIVGLQFVSRTSTSITFSWTADTNSTSYNVYVNAESTPRMTGVTGTQTTLTGLSSGSSLGIRISGVNSTGEGPLSDLVTMTTMTTSETLPPVPANQNPPAAPVPTGTIYWIAPDGNDSNAGTEAAPFATLQKAHDSLSPGDGVYIKSGTYFTRRLYWTKTDTILCGAPGTTKDQVILNAGGSGFGATLYFSSNRVNAGDPPLENIQLYGITIQGGAVDTGWIDEGFIIRGYVRNLKIINCVVRYCHNRGAIHGSDSSWDASDFPHNIEWAYCDFYSIGKDTAGGDISLGGRAGYLHIHHNELHGDVDGVVMEGAYIGSLIEYNNIYDHFGPDGNPETGSDSEDGVDLKLTRSDNPLLPSGHRSVIQYNRIYGHPKQSGITVQMAAKKTTIYKNAIYNNRTGIWSRPSERDGGRCCTADIIIEDNDIYDNYYRGITIAYESAATTQVTEVQILNNRIYDNGNEGGPNPSTGTIPAAISTETADATVISGNIISNNAILGSGNPQYYLPSFSKAASNNNTFYLPSTDFHVARVGDTWYNFSEWKTASGQDVNSTEIVGTYTSGA